METISRLRYFLYLSILIVGCTTGKNALQKGNFDASVQKSVDRLRNAPKNEEAQQVLAAAYPLALKDHLNKIEQAKLSSAVLQWEYILAEYQQLQELAADINSCTSCQAVIPFPQQFGSEITSSKLKAAEVRYVRGVRYLEENNRPSARKAYDDFEIAKKLYPSYKDVAQKLEDAYQAAVVRVVMEPVQLNSNAYQLSNAYFQQQIDRFTSNYRNNKFVILYNEKQAVSQKIKPDQVISLSFDDFVVGQTFVKERVEKMKRDSVIIGQTRSNKPIYATVNASFSIFDKKVTSSGWLSFVISDWQSQKVIRQQRLSGSYVWQDNWASYKGDERALTNQQLKLLGRREVLPPMPEVLFTEFTKPIYAQLVDEVNYFYSQY